MKNNYSQDFPDNDADASLVTFLKQNKAIAPTPAINFEEQLFAEISKYPQRSLKPIRSRFRRWLPLILAIPISIGAVASFGWFNRSQYQIANVTEAERAEIEQSLINGWNMNNDVSIQAAKSTDAELLSDLTPLDYE
ncbi:hypothetical protein HCU40_12990 [Pseudanabaena biceps]|nr:hypothetical protein [Pseudanabaena biceps]